MGTASGPARAPVWAAAAFAVILGGCKGCKGDTAARADAAADAAPSAVASENPNLPPAIPNAKAVTHSARPGMRGCFVKQIGRRPSPQGDVTFDIFVAADGHVTDAKATSVKGLDDETVVCMRSLLLLLEYPKALDGQPSTITAPFSFVSTKDLEPPAAIDAGPFLKP